MKFSVGDVVRIIQAPSALSTMVGLYAGCEAKVEHVDAERKLYQVRIITPLARGVVRFNVTERMVEPEVTEAMFKAARGAVLIRTPRKGN